MAKKPTDKQLFKMKNNGVLYFNKKGKRNFIDNISPL